MDSQIQEALKVFNQGGIVIFPTDTAFGIGCRIDNTSAVDRLFELRRRAETKATPVLVSNIAMAQEYVEPIDSEVRTMLLEKYWPGGLTVVMPAIVEKIPQKVRGGGTTLGVRMPNHTMLLEIIEQVGVPILAPSANFAGENTPFFLNDIDKALMKLVDYVVEGDTYRGKSSTVVDCTKKPWKILRQGAVELNI
jgi:L-threonylcarbamoyladenylate synthase